MPSPYVPVHSEKHDLSRRVTLIVINGMLHARLDPLQSLGNFGQLIHDSLTDFVTPPGQGGVLPTPKQNQAAHDPQIARHAASGADCRRYRV